MTIHESIKTDIASALRAKDTLRLTTLRSLLTSIVNELIAKKRKPNELLNDEETNIVLKHAANQRKESIRQFEIGGRDDLADIEKEELTIIETFLPKPLPHSEIERVVRMKIAELKITDSRKSGQLIGAVIKELKGNTSGEEVKEIVNKLLI